VQNFSYENEFDLHENEPVRETHFHINGFTQRRFDAEAKGNLEMTYCALYSIGALVLDFLVVSCCCAGQTKF